MSIDIDVKLDAAELRELRARLKGRAIARTERKAGSSALRSMRAESNRRIRKRKRLRIRTIRDALVLSRPVGRLSDRAEWGVRFRSTPVPLAAYPHRQTKRGVSVAVNRGGGRSLAKSAFLATMASGHRGIFRRVGARRLPITELLGSRPADALLHEGEADGVLDRGYETFLTTWRRVLPLELDKLKGGGGGG